MDRIYQTDDIKELAAALAKAQGAMKHATKDLENEAFKRGGKVSSYAGLDSVFDAARAALAANGLSVMQITDVGEDGKVFLITQLTHSSGEWMRSWYPVSPVKQDPQGLGSALTYSRRYAYMAMVGVAATDDDDDGNAASGKAQPDNSIIESVKAAEIDKLIRDTSSDRARFLNLFKVDDVQKLRASDYSRALAMLKQKAEQAKPKDAAKPEAQA